MENELSAKISQLEKNHRKLKLGLLGFMTVLIVTFVSLSLKKVDIFGLVKTKGILIEDAGTRRP